MLRRKILPIFGTINTQCSLLKMHNAPKLNLQTSHLINNINQITYRTFIRKLFTSRASTGKLYVDTENNYLYNILPELKTEDGEINVHNKITTLENFNTVLDKNFRVSSIEDIVQTFKNVCDFCSDNNIPVSDKRFDKLVDGLMDNCQHLTDEHIYELLICLNRFPMCESFDSHNFHDVWSCLDDVCISRMTDWDIDKRFLFVDAWYKLHLAKLSDFVFHAFDRLTTRTEYLTKKHVVQLFFFLNVCRKKSVDFNFEDAVEKYVKDMTVDELAIIASGYFKTRSKIKINAILNEMMDRVIQKRKTVNEMSLTAILKVIRLSKRGPLITKMNKMLDFLVPEIDRLSCMACLHIGIIGTSMQSVHKPSLLKATEKISKHIEDVEQVRLKDIERLIMVLSMFNIQPEECYDLYNKCFKELYSERRVKEFSQYHNCLPSTLNYFSLRDMYSYEHMDKIFHPDYIKEIYGKTTKNPKMFPRNLLFLDYCIDIDCLDYKGNRLDKGFRSRAIKYSMEYAPSYEYIKNTAKITPANQLFLDTVDCLKIITKNDDFVLIEHVLPHYAKADVIVCKNMALNKFVKPEGFENYLPSDVMYAKKDENLKWYAFVVVGWNNTMKGTSLVLGEMLKKKRQLEKLGFEPHFVIWNEFILSSKEDKVEYLVKKLETGI